MRIECSKAYRELGTLLRHGTCQYVVAVLLPLLLTTLLGKKGKASTGRKCLDQKKWCFGLREENWLFEITQRLRQHCVSSTHCIALEDFSLLLGVTIPVIFQCFQPDMPKHSVGVGVVNIKYPLVQ